MKPWVIARTADMVAAGESAFVISTGSDRAGLAYVFVADGRFHDGQEIDLGAYSSTPDPGTSAMVRTPRSSRASLSTAFEYGATETLVRYRRAGLVLRKLLGDSDGLFSCTEVSDEWSYMARALGAEPIAEEPGVVSISDLRSRPDARHRGRAPSSAAHRSCSGHRSIRNSSW